MTIARLSLSLVALSLLPATGAAADLPLAAFFQEHELSDLRLSPDGQYIAALARVESAPKARNIVVMHLDTREAQTVTGYKKEHVTSFFWVNENRLVFRLAMGLDKKLQYDTYLGMYSIDRRGRKGRELHNPYEGDSRSVFKPGKSSAKGGLFGWLQLNDRLPQRANEVLVTVTDKRFVFPEPYLLDVTSGALSRVAANDRYVVEWYADAQGRVLLAIDAGPDLGDGRFALQVRSSDDAPWRHLVTFRDDDLHVLGVSADGMSAFVASRHESDRHALYQLDLATGEFGDAIVADPVYDVVSPGSGKLFVTDDGVPRFFSYMADRPRHVYFDSEWQRMQATLDAALPDTHNEIVSWSESAQRALVFASSDRHVGSYHLYDARKAALVELLTLADDLPHELMSPMTPISFEARDGERIHGYLTRPESAAADQRVPLIIHPHGGPYGIRDNWRFNREVQFLASRGYAVLQVNYRGSGGYGRRFTEMAYKQWGLEMQDDLTDAAHWAIEEGYADPARIAIYGASYGGYATMMGLVKTPELYKCGINYVGVVDIKMQIRHWLERYNVTGARELMEGFVNRAIGNDADDQQRLRDTSPIHFVDRIQAPVLVVHGRIDGLVSIDQYHKLVSALQREGKEFESMVGRFEGHGFYKQQNLIELYTAIERFLEKNL